MNELITLLIAVAVHEFGHYIHYLLCGFKPKFEWIGIGPCVSPQINDIPVKYVLTNIFTAITFGMLVLISANTSDIAKFAYIVGCFMDINTAQMLLIYVWRKTITFNTSANDIRVVIKARS